jgi:hypothetical protein
MMTFVEIGRELGISGRCAQSICYRALRKLRKQRHPISAARDLANLLRHEKHGRVKAGLDELHQDRS